MSDSKKTEDQQGGVQVPPSWINKELIQVALCNAGEENPQVERISVSCPVAAGDNYAALSIGWRPYYRLERNYLLL